MYNNCDAKTVSKELHKLKLHIKVVKNVASDAKYLNYLYHLEKYLTKGRRNAK